MARREYAFIIVPHDPNYDLADWPQAYGPYINSAAADEWDRIKNKIDFTKYQVHLIRLRADGINTDHYSNKGD
jgi:hypothetical protein